MINLMKAGFPLLDEKHRAILNFLAYQRRLIDQEDFCYYTRSVYYLKVHFLDLFASYPSEVFAASMKLYLKYIKANTVLLTKKHVLMKDYMACLRPL